MGRDITPLDSAPTGARVILINQLRFMENPRQILFQAKRRIVI
jgi:hypothetical protein